MNLEVKDYAADSHSAVFPSINRQHHDALISFAAAWRELGRKEILPRDLDVNSLPDQYLAVVVGDRCVGYCPRSQGLAKELVAALTNRAHMINAMLSRSVMVYPCARGLVVIDMDRISKDKEIQALLQPGCEVSNELVTLCLIDAEARQVLPDSCAALLPAESRADILTAIKAALDGATVSRRLPKKIATIAIPSGRSSELLEKCLRSHLDSIRIYGHLAPKIVVYDDASPEEQVKKRQLCESLSREYSVTIEHRGDAEREAFLKGIFAEAQLESSAAEIMDLSFKRKSLGTMRNWIHLSNTTTTYATIDDDSMAHITVPDTLPVDGHPQSAHALRAVAKVIVKLFEAGHPSKSPSAGTTSTAVDGVDAGSFAHFLYSTSRMLEIFYANGVRNPASIVSPVVDTLLREGLFIEFKRLERTYWGAPLLHVIKYASSTVSHVLPVDLLSAHERAISATVETVQGLVWGEGEGSLLIRSQEPPSTGAVGAVYTGASWTGAGSVSNRISDFIDEQDASKLSDAGIRRSMSLPMRMVVCGRGKLSTTTMTTLSGNVTRGLLVSGLIDSHPLWLVSQNGDMRNLLAVTAAHVDHHQQPKPPVGMEDAKIMGEEFVAMYSLSLAYSVVFDGLPQEQAVRNLLAEVFGLTFELRSKITVPNSSMEKKAHNNFRLATALVEGFGIGLGFGEGMPTMRDLEAQLTKAIKRSAVVRKVAFGGESQNWVMSGRSLAEAYLLIPRWESRARDRIRRCVEQVRRAEEFGVLLHGAAAKILAKSQVDTGFVPALPSLDMSAGNVFGGEEVASS